jgi:sorting nexin-25
LKKDSRVEGQDQVYLRRLETGKRILDQKVLSLAGGTLIPTSAQAMAKRSSSSRMEHASLVQVLHDASGLSYFMEYMDRQRKMPIVQFWIVVDGLRNPLESDIADDEDFPHPPPEWSESDRLDILQINEAYLARKELKIPEQSRELVRTFVKAGRAATPVQYQKARAAILSAQTSVLHEMERECFPGFRQSDLFYKYLSTDEASAISTKPPPPVAPNFSPLLTSKTNRPKPELKTRATAMPPPQVPPSLLRNAASTSDLKESAPLFDDGLLPRRSLDTGPHPPLFDDDQDADPLSRSRQSIDTDRASGDGDHGPDTQVVQAMEAALTDIMDDKPNPEEDLRDALFGTPEPSLMPAKDGESPRDSLDSSRVEFSGQLKDGEKPSIASLGLVNTSSRIGVFFDDDLFPDEEKFLQDEHEDSEEKDVENKDVDDDIHRAAPGDLGLAEAIAALSLDIDKLVAQDAVVDTLTRKAELTNNAAELRILKKSKSSLEREMRRKELQRQQYIVQESDNSLYGRSDVKIKSIMVGTSDDGHEYALYVVEVQRNAGEQMAAATWAIARRYSEFHDLHQRLRMKYPSVRNLEFPRRRVVMKLQKDFLQKRRVALEKYLRELLQLPDVCRSRDLRAFLSQSAITSPEASIDPQTERQHIISRFYNSVSDGVEDFLGNIPVLDQLSVAGQNLISAATSQLGNNASTLPVTIAEDPLAAAEAEQELKAFEDREIEPFVKPICDIFLELFELNRGNNWLRGRAVVVVLHQLLGGTIERKVRDNAKQLVQDDSVLKYLDMIKETMWPNDVLKTDWKPRTMAEKNKSRTEASLMLATLLPDVAGNVVGRANAQVAARRVFATMNNARLKYALLFLFLLLPLPCFDFHGLRDLFSSSRQSLTYLRPAPIWLLPCWMKLSMSFLESDGITLIPLYHAFGAHLALCVRLG